TVVNLFGAKASDYHPRKVPRIVLTFVRQLAGSLIRLAGRNRADQELQIEITIDEDAGQFGEQFGVTRRVVDLHVIDRHDDADAEEMSPQPVARGPGKEGIVRG